MVNVQSASWMRLIAFGVTGSVLIWLLVTVREMKVPAKLAAKQEWGILPQCRVGDSYENIVKLCRRAESVRSESLRAGEQSYVLRWDKGDHVLHLDFVDRALIGASEQRKVRDIQGRIMQRESQTIGPSQPVTTADALPIRKVGS
jgi:hypothetical protein